MISSACVRLCARALARVLMPTVHDRVICYLNSITVMYSLHHDPLRRGNTRGLLRGCQLLETPGGIVRKITTPQTPRGACSRRGDCRALPKHRVLATERCILEVGTRDARRCNASLDVNCGAEVRLSSLAMKEQILSLFSEASIVLAGECEAVGGTRKQACKGVGFFERRGRKRLSLQEPSGTHLNSLGAICINFHHQYS